MNMVTHIIIEDFLSDSSDVTMEVACVDCGKRKTFTVSKAGYDLWVKGEPASLALVEVPVGQRQMLVTQTCLVCLDKL